jgi:hypothetical protein
MLALALAVVLSQQPSQEDRQHVADVIISSRGLQACFAKAMLKDPQTPSKVTMTLHVSSAGEVTQAAVVRSRKRGALEYETCVERVLKTLRFGPRRAPVTVRMPLIFCGGGF